MNPSIRPHHQRAINAVTKRFRGDPRYPALIIGGSVAKGWDRPDSDLDILLIATDDEWARREPRADIWWHDVAEDVFIDGKVLDMPYLQEVADAAVKRPGAESARAFRESLAGFQDWGMTIDDTVNRFMLDSEWNWRTRETPVYDR